LIELSKKGCIPQRYREIPLDQRKKQSDTGRNRNGDQNFFYELSRSYNAHKDEKEEKTCEIVQKNKNSAHMGPTDPDAIHIHNEFVDLIRQKREKICIPQKGYDSGNDQDVRQQNQRFVYGTIDIRLRTRIRIPDQPSAKKG
jgi:hypothetical protein